MKESDFLQKKQELELEKLQAEIKSLNYFNKLFIKLLPGIIQFISVCAGAIALWYTGVFEREIKLQKLENQEALREKKDLEEEKILLNQAIYKLYSDYRETDKKLKKAKKDLSDIEELNRLLTYDNLALTKKNEETSVWLNQANLNFYKKFIELYIFRMADYDTTSLSYLKENYKKDKPLINEIQLEKQNEIAASNNYSQAQIRIRLLALNYYLQGGRLLRDSFVVELKKYITTYEKNIEYYDNPLRAFYNDIVWTPTQAEENLNLSLSLARNGYNLRPQLWWHAAGIVRKNKYDQSRYKYDFLPLVYSEVRKELDYLVDTTVMMPASAFYFNKYTTYNLTALFDMCPPCFFAFHAKVIHDNKKYIIAADSMKSFKPEVEILNDSTRKPFINSKVLMGLARISNVIDANSELLFYTVYKSNYIECADILGYPNLNDKTKYPNGDSNEYYDDVIRYYKDNEGFCILLIEQIKYTKDNQRLYLSKLAKKEYLTFYMDFSTIQD